MTPLILLMRSMLHSGLLSSQIPLLGRQGLFPDHRTWGARVVVLRAASNAQFSLMDERLLG